MSDLKHLFEPRDRGRITHGLRLLLESMKANQRSALTITAEQMASGHYGRIHPATRVVDEAEEIQELLERFGDKVRP